MLATRCSHSLGWLCCARSLLLERRPAQTQASQRDARELASFRALGRSGVRAFGLRAAGAERANKCRRPTSASNGRRQISDRAANSGSRDNCAWRQLGCVWRLRRLFAGLCLAVGISIAIAIAICRSPFAICAALSISISISISLQFVSVCVSVCVSVSALLCSCFAVASIARIPLRSLIPLAFVCGLCSNFTNWINSARLFGLRSLVSGPFIVSTWLAVASFWAQSRVAARPARRLAESRAAPSSQWRHLAARPLARSLSGA